MPAARSKTVMHAKRVTITNWLHVAESCDKFGLALNMDLRATRASVDGELE